MFRVEHAPIILESILAFKHTPAPFLALFPGAITKKKRI
jgi:hypothetical protein